MKHVLTEMVYNLCDNALRYNRPAGSVRLSVKKDGEKAVLEVSDTGIGIAKEEQERIFERFYRVDASRSAEKGGTGLGLSIVKHAVQYHKGKITLNSEPGEGTEIKVTF